MDKELELHVNDATEWAIVVDMDSTLSDPKDRLHYVQIEPRNFEAFEAECHLDPVIEPVAAVVKAMYASGYYILIVSARMDNRRHLTEQWLEKHKIPYHKLYMRKHKDTRKDDLIKKEIYEQIKQDGYKVLFAIDDRKRVKKMWVSEGVFVMDVNQKDKEY